MSALRHWLDSPWTHADQLWAIAALFVLWIGWGRKGRRS